MKHTLKRYPGYSIDKNGFVYSKILWRGKIGRKLKGHYNNFGYKMVTLRGLDGKYKREFVHNLMVEHFLGNKNGLQVRHLDGDKSNNSLQNIKLGTAKENANDREKHGNTSRGILHSELIQLRKENSKLKRELGDPKISKAPEMYEAINLFINGEKSLTMGYYSDDQVKAIDKMKSLLKEIDHE